MGKSNREIKDVNFIQIEKNLSQSVVRGGFWIFLLRIINRFFHFIRIIILARILAPHDFGLMGIALMAIGGLDSFSQTGFQNALIQKKGDIKSYLDVAWSISILRGFILFGILYGIAPYVSMFFETPEIELIIQVIGLSLIFQGFTNVGVIYFQKELELNKQFIYQLVVTLSDFIVVVIAALLLKNVWALVFGLLAGNVMGLVASYLLHPYKPRLNYDLGKARELFSFGKWIFGSTIVLFLISQIDTLTVGKVLGITALGFYQMAYRISFIPANNITLIISQVVYPAYSKLQDNLPKLKTAYLETSQLTALLSFPIAGLIFILAPEFTMIVLGEKWISIVPLLQVLILWGLIVSFGATMGPLWQAVGKPRLMMVTRSIRLMTLIILIYPLTVRFGMLGAAYTVVITSIISTSVGFYEVRKILQYHTLTLANLACFPLVSTGIMIISVYISKTTLSFQMGAPMFIALILEGISIYIIMIFLFEKLFNFGISDIVNRFIHFHKSIK